MKLNNKGMAISGILYSILVLFLSLIFGVLSILASTKYSFDKFRKDLLEQLNGNRHNVKIEKVLYKEEILNGAYPEYDEDLIPVTIDNNGVVRKADLYSKWYSYEDGIWANIVSVTKSSRDRYETLDAGAIIQPDDILGYFVWIPRYKYIIPTLETETPSSINIVFEDKHVSKSTGDRKTTYYTHPGFTFGDTELNGIWFAKFETTGTKNYLTILPNKESLRNQDVKEEFEEALSLKDKEYGITSDVHMTKSVEWSAATFLSHSIYGINKEIRINNEGYFTTGCGASSDNGSLSSTCEIKYGNASSYPQSTTGNISGIFDMSGGAWDRVMANFLDLPEESNFTTFPDKKYYDSYMMNEDTMIMTFNGISNPAGSMIFETPKWYNDTYSMTFEPTLPWLHFGGYNAEGEKAGAFATSFHNGANYGEHAFRITISQGS